MNEVWVVFSFPQGVVGVYENEVDAETVAIELSGNGYKTTYDDQYYSYSNAKSLTEYFVMWSPLHRELTAPTLKHLLN